MKTDKPQTLSLQAAGELGQAGAVRQAVALGQRGDWALMIRVGMTERPLGLKRVGPRLFQSLDTRYRAHADRSARSRWRNLRAKNA